MKMLKRNAGVVKEINLSTYRKAHFLDCPVIMTQKIQSFKHCGHDKEVYSGKLGTFLSFSCLSSTVVRVAVGEVYASESKCFPF